MKLAIVVAIAIAAGGVFGFFVGRDSENLDEKAMWTLRLTIGDAEREFAKAERVECRDNWRENFYGPNTRKSLVEANAAYEFWLKMGLGRERPYMDEMADRLDGLLARQRALDEKCPDH
jgi:hypothetical protein